MKATGLLRVLPLLRLALGIQGQYVYVGSVGTRARGFLSTFKAAPLKAIKLSVRINEDSVDFQP